MLGAPVGRQDGLFYEFCLEGRVPRDHLLRKIDGVLDLTWLRQELAPSYSHTGRPSACPDLMIRMLLFDPHDAVHLGRESRVVGGEAGAAGELEEPRQMCASSS